MFSPSWSLAPERFGRPPRCGTRHRESPITPLVPIPLTRAQVPSNAGTQTSSRLGSSLSVARSIGVVAYDEDLANRIRQLLADEEDVTERKMFGGLAFLVNGNMAIAASGQGGILVRSDPTKGLPVGAETAIMRDRPMDGWLRVAKERLKTKAQLSRWVRIGTRYARSLPPKP
jgi:TfoX N-terminal domain